MRQELKFTVSREAENLHREPMVVPCDTKHCISRWICRMNSAI